MAVWTIDAEPGTGGREIAAALATRAGVPLVDHQFTVAFARSLGTTIPAASSLERQLPTLAHCGVTIGMACGAAPYLAAELRRLERTRETLTRVTREAARAPCVIFGRCAFDVLATHPGAIHVHLRAPLTWRAARTAEAGVLTQAQARGEIRSAARSRRRLARWLRRYDRRRAAPFHVVCDTSRLSQIAIVEMLLAAGRHRTGQVSSAATSEVAQ